MKTDERRIFELVGLKIEKRADNKPAIVGHAAVFDKLSVPLWGFREKIAKGAFSASLKRGDDVRALFNHDSNIVLGRTKNGTLTVKEDDAGLAIEITPPDTAAARDVISLIERGDVDQMSFGFRTVKDLWEELKPAGDKIRTLIEVDLFDVSPVTFPAYPETDVAVRGFKAFQAEAEAMVLAERHGRARSLDLAAA
jgi:HK97 family phage prohead protease